MSTDISFLWGGTPTEAPADVAAAVDPVQTPAPAAPEAIPTGDAPHSNVAIPAPAPAATTEPQTAPVDTAPPPMDPELLEPVAAPVSSPDGTQVEVAAPGPETRPLDTGAVAPEPAPEYDVSFLWEQSQTDPAADPYRGPS
jgi:hypothetical protein